MSAVQSGRCHSIVLIGTEVVDGPVTFQYTPDVRSVVAAIVAISVCSLQVHALAFHVHAVTEQLGTDRHTHGPAIHHHDYSGDDGRTPHVDGGDVSAGTVITVAIPVMTVCSPIDMHAEMTDALQVPSLQVIGEARAIEVRSHGPPAVPPPTLRGPPPFTFL